MPVCFAPFRYDFVPWQAVFTVKSIVTTVQIAFRCSQDPESVRICLMDAKKY